MRYVGLAIGVVSTVNQRQVRKAVCLGTCAVVASETLVPEARHVRREGLQDVRPVASRHAEAEQGALRTVRTSHRASLS